MQVNPKSLSFGIEIEFTRLSRYIAAKLIAEFFNTDVICREGVHDTYEIIDGEKRTWKIVRDASVSPEQIMRGKVEVASDEYQCELVSPILEYKDIHLLQSLIEDLRERGGAFANRGTGMHIHVGSSLITPKSLRNLCNLVASRHSLIDLAFAIDFNRRLYCNDLSEDFLMNLNRTKPKTFQEFADVWYSKFSWGGRIFNRYHESRYQVLNLHNILSGRFQAVEFRMFNGTLNEEKIKAYVQFSLLLTAQSLNQNRTTYKKVITSNPKYSFRVWILRMGGIGSEFKEMRHYLLKNLEGDSAYKNKEDSEDFYKNIF